MQTKKDMSKRVHFGIRRSLNIIATAACLWPAIAAAQPPNPTGSDSNDNTAAGQDALLAVTTGAYNTAMGKEALLYNTTGSNNSAVGVFALLTNTGSYNTAHGAYALFYNTTGSSNAAAGANALYKNTTGNYNTASGLNALFSNVGGSFNTASGVDALFSNTSGQYNTASGGYALYFNTQGSANTASGYYALSANTTGNYNTAMGRGALQYSTTGISNTASGTNALESNTTGSYNTATGDSALAFNTSGTNNTASGAASLFNNTTGKSNVAVGYGALKALTGNSNTNIALGTNAGYVTKTGSNNIYIGSPGATTESSVTRIGRLQTKAFIAGIKGVPLSGATVVVNGAGQLGVVASSARYKTDIRPLGNTANKLDRLRPVSYRYKTELDATHYGLIAEEVDKVMPELVVRDQQGRPESVQYLELIPLLLQERREMRARLDRQDAELAELRRLLDRRLAALDR